MENFIDLNTKNIEDEHICCAITDKKCAAQYQGKKSWLKKQFEHGYVFRRINARAKVFIEYGPSENSWNPVEAPNYNIINCFWVSGKYKKQGYGKTLLEEAMQKSVESGKNGLATITGSKKFHFMSDQKWLLKQGFETCDTLPEGFCLLVKKINKDAPDPKFSDAVKRPRIPDNGGIVVYYSDRCPFAECHVKGSLVDTAKKRNIPLKTIKINSNEEAKSSPAPATIFSLFYKKKFITTDISICLDTRFDKVLSKSLS